MPCTLLTSPGTGLVCTVVKSTVASCSAEPAAPPPLCCRHDTPPAPGLARPCAALPSLSRASDFDRHQVLHTNLRFHEDTSTKGCWGCPAMFACGASPRRRSLAHCRPHPFSFFTTSVGWRGERERRTAAQYGQQQKGRQQARQTSALVRGTPPLTYAGVHCGEHEHKDVVQIFSHRHPILQLPPGLKRRRQRDLGQLRRREGGKGKAGGGGERCACSVRERVVEAWGSEQARDTQGARAPCTRVPHTLCEPAPRIGRSPRPRAAARCSTACPTPTPWRRRRRQRWRPRCSASVHGVDEEGWRRG